MERHRSDEPRSHPHRRSACSFQTHHTHRQPSHYDDHPPPHPHLRSALSSLELITPPTACPAPPPRTVKGRLRTCSEAPAGAPCLPRRAPKAAVCSLSSPPRFFGAGDEAVPFPASRETAFFLLFFLVVLEVSTAATSPATFQDPPPPEGASMLSPTPLPFAAPPSRSKHEERSAKRQYAARFRSSEPRLLPLPLVLRFCLFFLVLPLSSAVVVAAAAAAAAAAATTLSPGR